MPITYYCMQVRLLVHPLNFNKVIHQLRMNFWRNYLSTSASYTYVDASTPRRAVLLDLQLFVNANSFSQWLLVPNADNTDEACVPISRNELSSHRLNAARSVCSRAAQNTSMCCSLALFLLLTTQSLVSTSCYELQVDYDVTQQVTVQHVACVVNTANASHVLTPQCKAGVTNRVYAVTVSTSEGF